MNKGRWGQYTYGGTWSNTTLKKGEKVSQTIPDRKKLQNTVNQKARGIGGRRLKIQGNLRGGTGQPPAARRREPKKKNAAPILSRQQGSTHQAKVDPG